MVDLAMLCFIHLIQKIYSAIFGFHNSDTAQRVGWCTSKGWEDPDDRNSDVNGKSQKLYENTEIKAKVCSH
jgi:hypothetical protein